MNEIDWKELTEFGVATVYEAAGRRGLIDAPLIQIIPSSRVAGPARTALCGQDDNLMVHALMAEARAGDVLVLVMPESRPIGLVGELLATQAALRNVAGILVNAAVRDTEELRRLGLPIWSRYIRAAGATKKAIGTLNHPVSLGGTEIQSGDAVILDADGACVVPQNRIREVVEASRARVGRESSLRKKLLSGQLSYDLHGLRALVEGTR